MVTTERRFHLRTASIADAREHVRQEALLDQARRERQAELARRERMAREIDERSTARQIEREARRAAFWREINKGTQRGRAPHEVRHE